MSKPARGSGGRAPSVAELEAAKRNSVGQLLLRAARLFNERGVERVRESGAGAFRLSHTTLFPHIDHEGTRLSELAERVGITKQSVGELVRDLETAGIVRRTRDPADGRARLVRFTARGRRALLHGLSILGRLETDLARELGTATMERLRSDLTRLLAALESGSEEGSRPAG